MPFGEYFTYLSYDLTDETTQSAFISFEGYGSRGATTSYAVGLPDSSSSSGEITQSTTRIGGNEHIRVVSGTTSHEETPSGSDGTTTEQTNIFSVDFFENQGFASTFYDTETTYYFSDWTDDSGAVLDLTHGGKTTVVSLRQTSSTELTLALSLDETITETYSEVTSYSASLNRSFTDTISISEYGTIISSKATCNEIIGKGYVIFPVSGTNWTLDGSSLMYRRIFSSTGLYGEYYTDIFKDNEDETTTFEPDLDYLSPNVTAQGAEEVIPFSDVVGTITYDVISQQSESFTIPDSYDFYLNQFVLNTEMGSSSQWNSLYAVSSELSYTNQEGVTIGPYGDSSAGSYVIGGAISTTRFINVDTTIASFSYSFANTKSTYVSYRALAKTISTLSYLLYSYENTWGAKLFTSSTESGTTIVAPSFDFTVSVEISQSGLTSYSFFDTHFPIKVNKALYSLEYPAPPFVSEIYPTFFTQKSPDFRWVLADAANPSSATMYFNSLSEVTALTKLYFTTYKYHRYGIINAPIFAVPIDFTSESDSSVTYQAVSIPSNFYFGVTQSGTQSSNFNAVASATQTYSTLENSAFNTSTFTIRYVGSGSHLKMKTSNINDISGNGDPATYENIFHTIAVMQNSSGCASWSMDNYYYWVVTTISSTTPFGTISVDTTSRIISGTVSSPISIVGDNHPFTFIASEWLEQFDSGLPYVAIDVSYQNSYSYS